MKEMRKRHVVLLMEEQKSSVLNCHTLTYGDHPVGQETKKTLSARTKREKAEKEKEEALRAKKLEGGNNGGGEGTSSSPEPSSSSLTSGSESQPEAAPGAATNAPTQANAGSSVNQIAGQGSGDNSDSKRDSSSRPIKRSKTAKAQKRSDGASHSDDDEVEVVPGSNTSVGRASANNATDDGLQGEAKKRKTNSGQWAIGSVDEPEVVVGEIFRCIEDGDDMDTSTASSSSDSQSVAARESDVGDMEVDAAEENKGGEVHDSCMGGGDAKERSNESSSGSDQIAIAQVDGEEGERGRGGLIQGKVKTIWGLYTVSSPGFASQLNRDRNASINLAKFVRSLIDFGEIPWEFRKEVRLRQFKDYKLRQYTYKAKANSTNSFGQIMKFSRRIEGGDKLDQRKYGR
jgi:hypothetical protein